MLFGPDTELTKQLDAAGSEEAEGHKRGSSSTSDAVTSLDGEQSGRRTSTDSRSGDSPGQQRSGKQPAAGQQHRGATAPRWGTAVPFPFRRI